jgi:septation ring formation regulator EzrA
MQESTGDIKMDAVYKMYHDNYTTKREIELLKKRLSVSKKVLVSSRNLAGKLKECANTWPIFIALDSKYQSMIEGTESRMIQECEALEKAIKEAKEHLKSIRKRKV